MSFDWLAPHYQWAETLMAGKTLQECRTQFLGRAAGCGDILILGEGNGRFLAALRRVCSTSAITCVDSSSAMLLQAKRRLEREGLAAPAVDFIQANALHWHPPEKAYDLLVTHFFLDCFRADQLALLIPKLAKAARERAIWLLSDFAIPAAGLRRARAQVIHALMYRFFRVTTALPARRLTAPGPLLKEAGFELRERRQREWGLLQSDCWARA